MFLELKIKDNMILKYDDKIISFIPTDTAINISDQDNCIFILNKSEILKHIIYQFSSYNPNKLDRNDVTKLYKTIKSVLNSSREIFYILSDTSLYNNDGRNQYIHTCAEHFLFGGGHIVTNDEEMKAANNHVGFDIEATLENNETLKRLVYDLEEIEVNGKKLTSLGLSSYKIKNKDKDTSINESINMKKYFSDMSMRLSVLIYFILKNMDPINEKVFDLVDCDKLDDKEKKEVLVDILKDINKHEDIEEIKELDYMMAMYHLFEKHVEENIVSPLVVHGLPKEVSPLAKSKNKTTAERFEIFVAGFELANGYNEQNCPLEQYSAFLNQLSSKDEESINQLDTNYLNAMMCGMPQTIGIGIGIDRLIMLLTNKSNIKDVISFPALKPIKESLLIEDFDDLVLNQNKIENLIKNKYNNIMRDLLSKCKDEFELTDDEINSFFDDLSKNDKISSILRSIDSLIVNSNITNNIYHHDIWKLLKGMYNFCNSDKETTSILHGIKKILTNSYWSSSKQENIKNKRIFESKLSNHKEMYAGVLYLIESSINCWNLNENIFPIEFVEMISDCVSKSKISEDHILALTKNNILRGLFELYRNLEGNVVHLSDSTRINVDAIRFLIINGISKNMEHTSEHINKNILQKRKEEILFFVKEFMENLISFKNSRYTLEEIKKYLLEDNVDKGKHRFRMTTQKNIFISKYYEELDRIESFLIESCKKENLCGVEPHPENLDLNSTLNFGFDLEPKTKKIVSRINNEIQRLVKVKRGIESVCCSPKSLASIVGDIITLVETYNIVKDKFRPINEPNRFRFKYKTKLSSHSFDPFVVDSNPTTLTYTHIPTINTIYDPNEETSDE